MDRLLVDPRSWGVMLAATLTVMSNATITPSLPGLEAAFADDPLAPTITRLLITAPSLLVAVVAPLAGVLTDRLGRRRVLLAGLAIALFGTWLAAIADHIATLVVARTLQGAGSAAGPNASGTARAARRTHTSVVPDAAGVAAAVRRNRRSGRPMGGCVGSTCRVARRAGVRMRVAVGQQCQRVMLPPGPPATASPKLSCCAPVGLCADLARYSTYRAPSNRRTDTCFLNAAPRPDS